MALIGGGGAGNVAGSNPTGTGGGLNYLGNHVYLYSGVIGVNGNETTLVNADVALNQYIRCKLQIFNSSVSNDTMTYKVKINDEVVMQFTLSQVSTNLYTSDEPIDFIIAGGSNLTITAQSAGVSARDHTASVTGRVYI